MKSSIQERNSKNGDAEGKNELEHALQLAQEDLRWSEKRYRRIFEHSIDGILLISAEQHLILDVNESMVQMLGYSRSKILYKCLTDICPDQLGEIVQLTHQAIHEDKATGHELVCHTKDGTLIYTEVSASIVDLGGWPSILCLVRNKTEQKRAEEALRFTQFSIDHASDAAFWMDSTGKLIYTNRAASALLGYGDEELPGMNMWDIDHHIQADTWSQFWNRLRKQGSEVLETQHQTKDGQLVPVEVTANFVVFGGQEYNCAFARNITERRELEGKRHSLEMQLRQSEKTLDSIIKYVPDIIYRLDRDGKITFVNDAVKRYGYETEELIGASIFDLIHPEDCEAAKFRINERRTGDRMTRNLEVRLLAKDHSGISFEIHDISVDSPTFLIDAEGLYECEGSQGEKYLGTQGVARDITRRKLALKALQHSETKFRGMFNASAVGIVIIDLQQAGTILESNPAIHKMLSLTADEINGTSIIDYIHPEDIAADLGLFQEVLEGEHDLLELERRYVRKDGQVGWADFTISLLHSNGNKPSQAMCLVHDITDRKLVEEALRESEEHLRLITDNIPGLVAYVDSNMTYRFANAGYERWFGLKREDIVGKQVKDLLDKEAHKRSLPFIKRALGGEEVEFEGKLQLPHGSVKYFMNHMVPHQTAGAQVEGYFVLVSDITEIKKADEALQDSEERYRRISENTSDYSYSLVVAADGTITVDWIGGAFENITGYAKDFMSDIKKWLKVIHPDDMPAIKEATNQVLRHQPAVFEYRIRTKSGEERWLQDSSRGVWDDKQQRVVSIISAVRDITERKQAELALSRELAVTRALAELSNALIKSDSTIEDISNLVLEFAQALTNSDHGFVSSIDLVNRDNVGHTLTQMMPDCAVTGKDQRIAFPIGPDGKYPSLWGHALNNGKPFYTNSPRKHPKANGLPDGHVPLDNYLSVPAIAHGEIVGQISLANTPGGYTDTHMVNVKRLADLFAIAVQRKTAENERVRLEAAIEQSSEAIMLLDLENKLKYVNPAFEMMTGYSRSEVIGRYPYLLDSGLHERDFFLEMSDTVKNGKSWSGRMTNRRKDNTLFEADVTVSPVRDISGNITNFVSVMRDVTKEIALEAQLRQSQKLEAIGSLSGGIAHDFNNLLTAIMANTELLRGRLEQDSLEPITDEILKISHRAASTVQQLLAFSTKQELELEVRDLAEIIRSSESILVPLIREDIEIVTDIAPQLDLVRVNSSQIEQVLMNLVLNARDAITDGGRITIGAQNTHFDKKAAQTHPSLDPGSYVSLWVRDTGAGIPQEHLESIFNPFFTTKEPGKGTGLGLATVYGIIQQSGGVIMVDSELGIGTTFTIYLPAVDEQEQSISAQTECNLVASGSETILLVEDEESLRVVFKNILELHGYQVLEADNGENALNVNKRHSGEIDLLITDVVMPRLNGIELAKQLLTSRPGIKTLFVSGHTMDIAIPSDFSEHGYGFLQKPYTSDVLHSKIRELLDSEGA